MIELLVWFPYARSERGEPCVCIPIHPVVRVTEDLIVATALSMMEQLGREHHGSQSMPSMNIRAYKMVGRHSTVRFDDLDERDCRELDMLYIGFYGHDQRQQWERLGGSAFLGLERSLEDRTRARASMVDRRWELERMRGRA